ncbi:uncharacterized protein LOC116033061 [Ipomoea triloba]|uniref:uncharacterized protein LOC116033061 n=1 Tax=Ipomoea triloba TaxID=35885 RepID=UPI00125DBD0A|nr:uncharacterized protein LOC116033061 [Ipomoea triloba]
MARRVVRRIHNAPAAPKATTYAGSSTCSKGATDSGSPTSMQGNASSGSTSPVSPPHPLWKAAPEWTHVYNVMPAMATNAESVEEQLARIPKTLEEMTTLLQNQDKRINTLDDRVGSIMEGQGSRAPGKQPGGQEEVVQQSQPHVRGQEEVVQQSQPHVSPAVEVVQQSQPHVSPAVGETQQSQPHVSPAVGETTSHLPATEKTIPITEGMILVDQLNDYIMGAIKGKLDGGQSSYSYAKPYTQRIEELKMPFGYQPPKFQQFDGKGNPRQHIAHFVETCNDAGTDGDLLVKQFVRSLKGTAFDWYTDLESGCIDSWHDMEREFLTRFYSTRRTVSFLELTTTIQWKGERASAYIERWRELCLNCKENISQTSAIEMCIQGMHFQLSYILQGIKPKSFEELSSRAHDMELSIEARGGLDVLNMPNSSKAPAKQEFKRGNKPFPKQEKKEAMTVKATPMTVFTKANERPRSRPSAGSSRGGRRPTLVERQEKTYPFLDSDVSPMFDELLKLRLIELPEMRRPDEASRVNDPNYCKYHRLLGHSIEQCFIFKNKVMALARDGKIELADAGTSTNQISITLGRFAPLCTEKEHGGQRKHPLPFTVKHVAGQSSKP